MQRIEAYCSRLATKNQFFHRVFSLIYLPFAYRSGISLLRQGEDGTNQTGPLPVIPSVPVCFPGSGAFRVTFPVAKGDTGLLVFCSRSIDRWLSEGGSVDPQDDRTHDLSDAVFVPGLTDFGHPIDPFKNDRLTIGKVGGTQIHLKPSGTQVGTDDASQLDWTVLEAAADLGAKPFRAFFRVTLPLSLPGIFSGLLLVFIPALGEFIVPELLGGPDTLMVGRVLWTEFFSNRDWPLAAALAIGLLALILVPAMAMFRLTHREERA